MIHHSPALNKSHLKRSYPLGTITSSIVSWLVFIHIFSQKLIICIFYHNFQDHLDSIPLINWLK
jgi:hypothetical protein